MSTMKTKRFTLAQVLSITTGRLCCDMDGVYKILNHITGDELYTHVLPRAAKFAGPLLLSEFPEVGPANACLAKLDGWVAIDRTVRKTECAKMWIAELKLMFPAMDRQYDVPSHADAWLSLDPIQEAEDVFGPERVVVINPGDSK